ncbi:MAG: hypothetical protein AUI64_04330 [Acidobacteria bacterium 13_1_40CM_2_64_6]|nr:MAG: hypothetical protein AUI64_04330 [Acidobacteria bacterium 13_1_40CM_2_64_6]
MGDARGARDAAGRRRDARGFADAQRRPHGRVRVQPNGRPPTDFALTEITDGSATFENPSHDFPKMIRYAKRADGTLEARVSDGGQRAEAFLFRRTP